MEIEEKSGVRKKKIEKSHRVPTHHPNSTEVICRGPPPQLHPGGRRGSHFQTGGDRCLTLKLLKISKYGLGSISARIYPRGAYLPHSNEIESLLLGLCDIEKICDTIYCKNNCDINIYCDIDIFCDFDIRCDINIKCDVNIKLTREIQNNCTNDI